MGMRRKVVAAASVALAVGATACGDRSASQVPGDVVLAAYVLLGPGTDGGAQAQARVVVPGTSEACPKLGDEAQTYSMSFRADPHGFSVRVCEALIPFDRALRISWNDQILPAATRNPSRLVLFGDTGCKAKDCAPGTAASPFDALAREASAITPRPELVLHVGDYNYRGTPGEVAFDGDPLAVYDAGDDSSSPLCQLDGPYVSQNAGYSDVPDSWETWRVDFFEPATDLLAAAPFVFARGNHELCSRAGPGWFFFLDASSALTGGQLACPPQGDDEPPAGDVLSRLVLTPPRTIDLGSLRVVVIDDTNACDDHAPAETVALYRDQLVAALGDLSGDTPTWILTHRPFWGLNQLDPAEVINQTMEAAFAEATLALGGLPPSVRLFVAGHMHLFQSLTFGAPLLGDSLLPPQLIVGNGGVETSSGPGDGSVSVLVDGRETSVLTSSKHGFLTLSDLAPDGSWAGVVVDPGKDETIATCAQPAGVGGLCTAP